MTSRSWRLHAACAGKDELFFAAEMETKPACEEREAEARAVCGDCPVRRDCLDFSLRRSLVGIWAALDEKERSDLASQLGIPRLCPAEEHVMEGANVYVSPSGSALCRPCRAAADRRKRARKSAGRPFGEVAA